MTDWVKTCACYCVSPDSAVQKLLAIQALALLTGGLVTLIALAAMTQGMHRDANRTRLERGHFHDTIPNVNHIIVKAWFTQCQVSFGP